MKTFMLTGINKMEIKDVPDPGKPAKGELLLRVDVVGVCGSDIHYYTTGRIGTQVVEYPFTVGHEFAGTVLETGEGVKNFK
ncbi:MAG: alcohol dehydrogenase catalytic domain-containing protein, partial [Bacteroidales bacterium]|nr:alcohol dehydrogenase catalytic domain-containing protein [Bacteroidales bacterium]